MLSEKKKCQIRTQRSKSICQSRNVISCCANEIEMKGFNVKMGN